MIRCLINCITGLKTIARATKSRICGWHFSMLKERSRRARMVNTMIVEYDKELDVVYISKKINDRWIQVGFTSDEVDQINNVRGGK
jgi:hypothetical protein